MGAEYFELYDDFETGGPAMAGRTGWDGDLAKWTITAGRIHNNEQYGATVSAFFGGDRADFDVTYDYLALSHDFWEYYRQSFPLWRIDADNQSWLELDTSNKRISQYFLVGGSFSTQNWTDLNGTAGGAGNITFLTQGKLRVQVDAEGHQRMWIDGTALRAPGGATLDLAAIVTDPAHRHGDVGVAQGTNTDAVIDAIGIRPATITCTDIDRAVGRDARSGPGAATGTVMLAGTYDGTPVQWVYKVIDALDRTTLVQDWRAVVPATAAGSWSMAAVLPLGGPYLVVPGFQTEAGGPVHSTFSPPTLVGRRVIAYGQSTSVGRGEYGSAYFARLAGGAVPGAPYNDGDYPSGYMVNGADPFADARNIQGWGFVNAATQIEGVPVLFEAYGNAGANIAGLIEGTSAWTDFAAALATRKGVIEAVIWDQGQGDTDVSAFNFDNTNYPAYADDFLDGIVAPLRALAEDPNLPIVTPIMGRYASSSPASGTSQAVFDSQRDRFRRLKYSLTAQGGGSDPHIHCGAHHVGLLYGDAYHPTKSTETGYYRLNERDAWSVFNVIGTAAHDGRGPVPMAATRSGSTISIALDMNGAGALDELSFDTDSDGADTPSQPAGRFRGWDFSLASDFASLLAVTGVAIGGDGESLDFTLDAPPGAPVHVRYLHGAGFDDSLLFHGVYSGADHDHSIPVAPTLAGDGSLLSD